MKYDPMKYGGYFVQRPWGNAWISRTVACVTPTNDGIHEVNSATPRSFYDQYFVDTDLS